MEWIDVNDRLPEVIDKSSGDFKFEQSENILLFSRLGGVEIGYRARVSNVDGDWDEFYTGGGDYDVYPFGPDSPVTHWMPIPKAPEQ